MQTPIFGYIAAVLCMSEKVEATAVKARPKGVRGDWRGVVGRGGGMQGPGARVHRAPAAQSSSSKSPARPPSQVGSWLAASASGGAAASAVVFSPRAVRSPAALGLYVFALTAVVSGAATTQFRTTVTLFICTLTARARNGRGMGREWREGLLPVEAQRTRPRRHPPNPPNAPFHPPITLSPPPPPQALILCQHTSPCLPGPPPPPGALCVTPGEAVAARVGAVCVGVLLAQAVNALVAPW